MRVCRNRLSGQRRPGTTVVEGAICFGACMLFMMAIYEYGRFVMFRQVLVNAAREGARTAVISPSSTPPAVATQNVNNTVTAFLSGQSFSNLNVQLYKADAAGTNTGAWTDAPFGNNIAVEIQADYNPLFPTFGMLPNPVTITTKCMMRSEAN